MSQDSSLAAALVAAQSDMPKVEKDAVNPHFRSQFVSLDHLIALTRPVLNKHGLAITQHPTHIDGQPALETRIVHGPSGEHQSSVMPLLLGKNDMQGLGGAVTYARRYAWAAALGIASEEDDDGNQVSAPAEQVVAQATPSPATNAGGTAAPPAPFTPPPGASAEAGDFTFPSGKHKDKKLSEVPPSYLDWYVENGPRQDVKTMIDLYRMTGEQVQVDGDIPF